MRKPYYFKNRPQNRMNVCQDCGAGFRERTDATKEDRHCFVAGGSGTSHGGSRGLHHGFTAGQRGNRYPWQTAAEFDSWDLDNA